MPVQEVFTALHRPLMDPVAVLRNSPRHGRRIDQMDGELICWENVSLHCFARISGVNTKNRNENTYQSVTKTGVCVSRRSFAEVRSRMHDAALQCDPVRSGAVTAEDATSHLQRSR